MESGSVRLVDDREHRLVDLCGEGDFFGVESLLTGQPLPYNATAPESTVCALLRAERFERLCAANKAVADFFEGRLRAAQRAMDTDLDAAGARVLFGTPVGELTRGQPLTCDLGTTVQEAARRMQADRLGSILVLDHGRAVGILTDTDLRDKVVADGTPLNTCVEHLMSSPVVSVGADTVVFDAMMEMSRRSIHHLVVTDEPAPSSAVVGVISDQDIVHAHGQNPAATFKRIEKARTVKELARIRTEADGQLLRLYRQGVQAEDLAEVVTHLNDRLTTRVLRVVEAELAGEGTPQPEGMRWVWLALGSEGRRVQPCRGAKQPRS